MIRNFYKITAIIIFTLFTIGLSNQSLAQEALTKDSLLKIIEKSADQLELDSIGEGVQSHTFQNKGKTVTVLNLNGSPDSVNASPSVTQIVIPIREKWYDFDFKTALITALLIAVTYLLFRNKKLPRGKSKSSLTSQELAIVELIKEEKKNREIAEALFISISTVKTHINNIYRKLNISSREELKSVDIDRFK